MSFYPKNVPLLLAAGLAAGVGVSCFGAGAAGGVSGVVPVIFRDQMPCWIVPALAYGAASHSWQE